MRRLVPIAIAAVLLGGIPFAASGAAGRRCTQKILVLSAFPGEIDKILTSSEVTDDLIIEHKTFFIGRLLGNDVVMGLTGIGLVNADRTTKAVLKRFQCGSRPGFKGIVYSGISGGKTYIGDVIVPRRWTLDEGKTWFNVDPKMLAVVRAVKKSVRLAQQAPMGDHACVGMDPELVGTVSVTKPPQILVGGSGASSDSNGGRAWPCFPGGGDLFGCEPCRTPARQIPPDIAHFIETVLPFVDPAFFMSAEGFTAAKFDAVDQETAVVAKIAARSRIPFIGFRSISDSVEPNKGDPYNIPDSPFPFQLLVYKQLAAHNAATVALAFLKAWAKR
jgi:nucleoside phosphorylase